MRFRADASGVGLAAAALLIAGSCALPAAHAQGSVVRLEGNPQTTQFGWFDNAQPPVARIRSGDTIVMETLIHGDKQVVMNEEDASEHIGFALYDTVKVWSSEPTGTAPGSELKDTVRKQIDDSLEKFIKDYQAANPKLEEKP